VLLLIPSTFRIREENIRERNKKREREQRGMPKPGRGGVRMRSAADSEKEVFWLYGI